MEVLNQVKLVGKIDGVLRQVKLTDKNLWGFKAAQIDLQKMMGFLKQQKLIYKK